MKDTQLNSSNIPRLIFFQFHHKYNGIATVLLKELNFEQINNVTITTEIMQIHNNPAEDSSFICYTH
jgi:hypothetical protein